MNSTRKPATASSHISKNAPQQLLKVPRLADRVTEFEDRRAGVHLRERRTRGLAIEPNRFGQIDLGDQGDLRGVEGERIFQWFIFAFGRREEDNAPNPRRGRTRPGR